MSKKKSAGALWIKGLLIALIVILSLLLAAMIFVTVYWEQKLNLLNYVDPQNNTTLSSEKIEEILKQTDPPDPTFTGPVIDPGDIDWGSEEPVVIPNTTEHLNILLIGQDRREGQGRQRSDAMILVSVNRTKKTVTLTSFMRDIYVKIPGYAGNLLNVAYALDGMPLLDKTLEVNFGVQVDGNVEVDFGGFMSIIDVMGGVTINLTEEEARYLNRNGNWDVGGGGWALKEGDNVLTGDQALAYSRIRAIGMDFERTERQRKVITALFEKVKSMNLLELNKLLDQILPMITTDLTGAEITSYLVEFAPILMDLNIVTQRIPIDGTWDFAVVEGHDSIVVNFDANRKFLLETLQ